MWEKKIEQGGPLRLLGRYNPRQPVFLAHWTGSGVEIRIRCRRLDIEMEAAQAQTALWVTAMVDGAPVTRFPVETGRRWYTVLDGMDETVTHTVRIVRDTQPMEGDGALRLAMHAIRSDGELLEAEPCGMTIEFVGDSLTSGEGTLGAVGAMEWITAWMSSRTYAHGVCEALHARGRVVSQSGWGVYSSWDGFQSRVLPRVYDAVCGVGGVDETPYDFAMEPAQAVVINLGTNDGSALAAAEDKAAFRREIGAAAEAFIRQIRRKNPDAYILWAYGMCGGAIAPTLRAAVERVRRAGDERVGYVSLPACREEELGSRQHPGQANHRRAAEAIAAHLKNHMDRKEADQ